MQGVSWALVLIGGLFFYDFFSPFGFITTFFATVLGSLLGLFFVIFFEIVYLQIEKNKILKEQTSLLSKINSKLDKIDKEKNSGAQE